MSLSLLARPQDVLDRVARGDRPPALAGSRAGSQAQWPDPRTLFLYGEINYTVQFDHIVSLKEKCGVYFFNICC